MADCIQSGAPNDQCKYLTRTALSRAHNSAKAADVAKLLLLKQTPGDAYPLVRSMAVLHLTGTLTAAVIITNVT